MQGIWRADGMQPHRMRQFRRSTDPQFAPKQRPRGELIAVRNDRSQSSGRHGCGTTTAFERIGARSEKRNERAIGGADQAGTALGRAHAARVPNVQHRGHAGDHGRGPYINHVPVMTGGWATPSCASSMAYDLRLVGWRRFAGEGLPPPGSKLLEGMVSPHGGFRLGEQGRLN